MNTALFVGNISEGCIPSENEPVFKSIWNEYERIIVESLITSFGLDFFINDQHGGDVDTIHNVREIGKDPDMKYKNNKNAVDYDNRGKYDRVAYHNEENFKQIKRNAKQLFNEKGVWIEDAYTGGRVALNKGAPREKQAQLDHVISAKDVHEDAGRVLAGLDGKVLANSSDNLKFTNACLNNNMRDKTVPEYLEWCEKNPDKVNWNGKKGEPIPEDVKKRLLDEYNESKKAYDKKINTAYYTSFKFSKDLATAAGKRGIQMGIRQAFGFVFAEIWFSVKKRIQDTPVGCKITKILEEIEEGIKEGVKSAREKYKDVLGKFEDGVVSGALASITTTLCNTIFTTSKRIVKNIRQVYASVVQAGKVLFLNPEDLMMGERVKKTSIILATGASVLLGALVGELISETPIGKLPGVGDGIVAFCSSMVSGMLSCSFLLLLDRSEFIIKLIEKMNSLPSEVGNFKEIAIYLEEYAAELEKLDIEKFKKDTQIYNNIANEISSTKTTGELNIVLKNNYKSLGLSFPWEGNFDDFMSKKTNRLVFS